MSEIHFHFSLSANDVAAPEATGTDQVVETSLMPNHHYLGHGLHGALRSLAVMGVAPTELGIDFLLVGLAVVTADKNVSRKAHGQDSWTRELAVGVPVSDPARWNPLTGQLAQALNFLTGDRWRFVFRPRPQGFETLAHGFKPATVSVDSVSLLSGGLDSFIGAIDLLASGRSVLFVSHSAVATDSSCQNGLLQALERQFPGQVRAIRSGLRVDDTLAGDLGDENTERSRSFLFFSLAILCTSALPWVREIQVPENGLISLNVPLEDLRLGALSTRTTHPYFIARTNEILRGTGIGVSLHNPYQFRTKGNMVRECRNATFLGTNVNRTISCSSPNSAKMRTDGRADQCGYCMPCLIRRAALFRNVVPDTTVYELPSLTARPLRTDQREGQHVRAFQAAMLRLNGDLRRARMIVHESGSLSDYRDKYDQFAETYLNGINEVAALLNGVTTRPHG